jgi:dTDP-4-dehydrorhamnose 3,5-epimerase
MIFKETKIKGAYLIDLEKNEDERGFFARSFCLQEFKEHGIDFNIAQCNISFNKKKGTLRGMHYQSTPFEEAKLVSCIKGRIYDVIIDLRKDSATYCQWLALELREQDYRILYVPKGFAHGFQTLESNSVVFYQMSEFYHPECARGIRWDDPLFLIEWPSNDQIISAKDRTYPLYIKNIL